MCDLIFINTLYHFLYRKIKIMKASYSHIPSRVYDSYKKNHSLSPYSKPIYKSTRQSIEKVSQIGEQHYKQAMKHVNKFNKFDKDKKASMQKKEEIVDPECSFKPKLYKSRYSNCALKLTKDNLLSKTDLNLSRLNDGFKNNPEKQLSMTGRYLNKSTMSGQSSTLLVLPKGSLEKSLQKSKKKKTYKNSNADRMMQWAKGRDSKIINKTIQIQVSKTISPRSSYSGSVGKSKNAISRLNINENSFKDKMSSKKLSLNITESNKNNNQHNVKQIPQHLSATVTPRRDYLQDYKTLKNATSQSTTQTPRTDRIVQNKNVNSVKNSRQNTKRLSEINSQTNYHNYGQKLLAKQAQRGEGSFYLRQARANIKKNYQGKTDLLVKDRTYTKKFSYIC